MTRARRSATSRAGTHRVAALERAARWVARAARRALLFAPVALALALVVAGAPVAYADEPAPPVAAPGADAAPPAPAAAALASKDLERALWAAPKTAIALVLLKFVPAVIGLVLLVFAWDRRRARRAGFLPPPRPVPPPTAVGDPVLGVGVVFGVFVAQQSLGVAWVRARSGATGGRPPTKSGADLVAVLVATALPMAIVAVVGYVRRRRRRAREGRPAASWTLVAREAAKALCIASALLVAVGLVWAILLRSLHVPTDVQEPVRLLVRGSASDKLAIAVFGTLVAPVTEEFLFRVWLFGSLRTALSFRAAAVLTSAAFAAVHQNLPASLPLFVLAMFLAWAYERTDSVRAPILVHVLFNASGTLPLLLLG